jgi:hypothetical protein
MNNLIACPADCATELLLPAILAEQDCTNYDQYYSQVSDLYIIPDGAADIFASWSTTPTLVSGAIDNTVADNSKAKWLVGIGSVPPSEKISTIYPKGKTRITKRTYTLTFKVLNMSAAQREFLRKLQCGSTDFAFYYGDRADFVYGKAAGLLPKSIDVDMPQEGDEDSRQYANIIITWEANGDAERRTNPAA